MISRTRSSEALCIERPPSMLGRSATEYAIVPDPDERANGKTALRDVKHANEQVENFKQPHTRFGERHHPAHRFRVMDHVFILFRKQTLMFLGKRLEQSEQPGDGVVVVKIFGKAFDARLRFLHARKGRVHLPGAPLVHEVKKRHPKQREQSHLKIVVEDVSQSEHDRKRDLDRGQHIDDDHLGNLVAIVEQARKQVPFLVPFKRRIRRFQHPPSLVSCSFARCFARPFPETRQTNTRRSRSRRWPRKTTACSR